MKTKFKKLSLFLVLVLLVIFTMSIPVFAHGVQYQGLEGDKVQFTFDDGSPFNGAFVNVYDTNREIIDTSETDAEGYFDFSGYDVELAAIEAQDPAGHRSVYHIEEGVMAEPGVYVPQGGGGEEAAAADEGGEAVPAAAQQGAAMTTGSGPVVVYPANAPGADNTTMIVIVAIAAVAVVGIVAIVALFLFNSGKKKSEIEYVEVVEESARK